MPQVANIVLTDGTTPATFNPVAVKPGAETVFSDRSLGIKALESDLIVSARDGGNDSEVVHLKLTLPHIVVNTETGKEEVVERSLGEIKFRFASVSTEADRALLKAYTQNALDSGQAILGPVLSGNERIWG